MPPSTSTSIQPPLTEFTIFNKLPIELRLKIWNLSVLDRKVIWSHFENETGKFGVLQACRESRNELRHKYTYFYHMNQHSTGRWIPSAAPPTLCSSPVYVNYEIDTFCYQHSLTHLGRQTGYKASSYILQSDAMNDQTLPKLLQRFRRLIIHLDLERCFSNPAPDKRINTGMRRPRRPGPSMHCNKTYPEDWEDETELNAHWKKPDTLHVRLMTKDQWRAIDKRFPVLEEISVVFTKDVEEDKLHMTTYHEYGYNGTNKLADFAIAKVKEKFARFQAEGSIKKDLILSFKERGRLLSDKE